MKNLLFLVESGITRDINNCMFAIIAVTVYISVGFVLIKLYEIFTGKNND
jgi:hypothetical protein